MRLKDKVTVVTGGNSGIGFGIAEAFNKQGAKGVITGRNQENLDSSVAQLGKNFIGIAGDVTKLEDLDRTFKKTADQFGKIDVLVVTLEGQLMAPKWDL
jgi:NAD(P)-dependent dehydrogenase (short-subunit alcohol dehydrogenase family)